MKFLYYFLLFLSFSISVFSQELDCKVSVNASALATEKGEVIDKSVFSQIELYISEIMNNQRWTTDAFSKKEKIKCSLTINLLKSKEQNVFSGNAILQVYRPVFGVTYETVTFQYVDRSFNFAFRPEDRQQVFNEQSVNTSLNAILGVYSLIVLAVDYDSYSKLGGTQFFDRAFNIVNLAATTFNKDDSWVSGKNKKSRYFLIENYRDVQFTSYREGFYEYHRLVLDDFNNNMEAKRAKVLEFLETVKTTATFKQNSVLIDSFFDAKGLEIVNMFSEAPKAEKQKAYAILNNLDSGRAETYRQLLK